MSRDEFRALKAPKKNKYSAKRVHEGGHIFDSGAEAKRWRELMMLQECGKIQDLLVHPSFVLGGEGVPILIRSPGFPNGRKARATWDFYYWDRERKLPIYEDVKSTATITEAYRLRRAVFEWFYRPARVEEIIR